MKGTDGSHRSPQENTSGRHGPNPLPFPYADSASAPLEDERLSTLVLAHYAIAADDFRSGRTFAFDELYTRLQPWLRRQLRSFEPFINTEEVKQHVMMNVFNQACAVRQANAERDPARHPKCSHSHPTPPVPTASKADDASGAPEKPHGQFDPQYGVPFRNWLRRALKNQALSELRKVRPVDPEVLEWFAASHPDLDEHILLQELLAHLTEFEAHVVRGLAAGRILRELAEELQCNVAKIHRTYRTAIQKMRAMAIGN